MGEHLPATANRVMRINIRVMGVAFSGWSNASNHFV